MKWKWCGQIIGLLIPFSDNLEARFYNVDLGPIKFIGGKSKSGSKHVPIPKEDMEEVL